MLIFISCQKGKSISKILFNENIQYWDEFDVKKGYITGSYSFNKNGSCDYYTYKQGKRNKIFDDDILQPHTWSLKNDSILNIQGFNRNILRFSKDSIVLQNIITGDTIFLVNPNE